MIQANSSDWLLLYSSVVFEFIEKDSFDSPCLDPGTQYLMYDFAGGVVAFHAGILPSLTGRDGDLDDMVVCNIMAIWWWHDFAQ